MSILKNAIDSISLGIEDYQIGETDPRRYISCTRNIFAGILLLFKHKLSELSPDGTDEVLIKQKIIPKLEINSIIWVGEGKKTVDVQGIQERFKSLKINIDWKKLNEIQNYRNNIEHYYATASSGSVQKMISDSFIVIVNFIKDYLAADPRDLLDSNTYEVMRSIDEVYEADKAICIEKLKSLSYFTNTICETLMTTTCSECNSGLITSNDSNVEADNTDYICRSCNHDFNYKDIVTKSFEKKYAISYRDLTNGAEDTSCECPECDGYFFYDEAICICCGYKMDLICSICDSAIPASEVSYFEGTCSYCTYRWEKMQAE
ncbi:hypothetical protein [Acinetobacter baumannii]|uniref:hypothetical protein n=1 Tax=Acinetobacter baumannii TaxID=470 RepID=UPI001C55A1F9|nr:hypothetical protein [Acinetobacter baumannii]MBW3009642.1 hypothetical protein [Acinetobacter baumannii]